jgi:DNA-binding IclR family transcriptional regulator
MVTVLSINTGAKRCDELTFSRVYPGSWERAVQVVDRVMAVLEVLESGERQLKEVTAATGLPRSTAYRLLAALRHHGFVASDDDCGFTIGPRVRELGAVADGGVLMRLAPDITERLCAATGISVQLYRLSDGYRECIAAANPFSGLRDVVLPGMRFPLGDDASSHVLTAWGEEAAVRHIDSDVLRRVRRQGWSLALCDSVATLSVPLKAPSGRVIAALSYSGPPRIRRQATGLRTQLEEAARMLEEELLEGVKP